MSKVAKAAVGLMAATLIAKFLGFGRELALASSYGASSTSDAFLVAMNIPAVLFTAVGTSLDTAFIPLYCDVKAKQGKKGAIRFANNVFNIIALICLALSIIGVIFAPQITKLFAVGFTGERLKEAVYFTRVTLLGMVFLGTSYIMMAYLQVNENFIIPGLMSVPNNIIVIIAIIISAKINPYLLPWGALIAVATQVLFQIPFAIKKGFRYKPIIDFKDEHLKKMLWLVGPVLIGVGVNQISVVVDKSISSTLAVGSVSALNYANKLNQFVTGMFIVSISSVIYPMLSKLSSEDNKKKFNESIVTACNTITLLVIPITVGAIILAEPIVKMLFQRGAFDARATHMTAIALQFFSIGLIGFGLRDILGKVFYSLQDTRTPMMNGVLAMGLNIILNLFFINFTNMQLAGPAFATSLAAITTIILLFRSLRKKIGPFGGDKIALVMTKSLISSLLMAVVTLFIYHNIGSILGTGSIKEALALVVSVGIGGIVYGISIIVLKVDEVNLIIDTVKAKIKKK